MKYIVELTRQDEFGNSTTINNNSIDRELCEYYALKGEKSKGWKGGKVCKHCAGRGVLNFDDPSKKRSWVEACYCVRRAMERSNINIDKLVMD